MIFVFGIINGLLSVIVFFVCYCKKMLSKVIQSYPKCYPKLSIFRSVYDRQFPKNIRKNKIRLSRKLFFEIPQSCIKVAPLSLG